MKHENFSPNRANSLRVAPAIFRSSHYEKWGKRTLDLIICLLALPLVLLVCAVLWLVNIRSDQKLIFAQKRVGKSDRVFQCFKFQTMVNDAEAVLKNLCDADPSVKAEWDTFQKLENDPRITKTGAFLRKTSLDELPQLFNVLFGDMSIVGPRPFMQSQKELYVAGGGRHYFDLRPGITGSWQVEGRGQSSFLSRIAYDRSYHENMSLKEDVRLICKTAKVILRMTGQ